jgi:hypothetical protein
MVVVSKMASIAGELEVSEVLGILAEEGFTSG